MDIMWKFQSQNESKVQHLLDEIAKNPKPDSKWAIFKPKTDNSTSNAVGTMDCEEIPDEEKEIVGNIVQNEYQEPIPEDELKDLRDLLENDIRKNMDSIAKLCNGRAVFWEYLADNLCEQNIQTFVQYFSCESSSGDNIGSFYRYFLSRLLIRKYSRFVLEAVLEIHKRNLADLSKYVLPVMYCEKDVPADVLTDFCRSVGDTDKTKVLEAISTLKHNTEIISKHLPSILKLYQTSVKTKCIQEYILDILLTYGEMFTKDKNYGRLLLIYIQNLKHYPKNYEQIEKVVLEHNSIFKRPCMTALQNLENTNL